MPGSHLVLGVVEVGAIDAVLGAFGGPFLHVLPDPSLREREEHHARRDDGALAAVDEALDACKAAATVVLIAHQTAAVSRSERVLVMEGGRVVQDGAPAELLRDEEGAYARLVRYLEDAIEEEATPGGPARHSS